jgi:O-antigen/teichoic acid export membrane protein
MLSYFSFNQLDAIFILRYLTKADLGVYSVAYQINGLILQLPTLAGYLLMPLFITVRLNSEDNQIQTVYFRDILPLLTLGLGLFCTCVAAIGYYVLPLIFGQDFVQVGSLLWIFAAATTVSVPVATGFLPLSNSTSTTYVQMFAAFAAAIFNISLNVLLIPRFGLIGCAWATVAAFTANMIIFAWLLGRKFALPRLTAMLATCPALLGAACFSWNRNVIFSVLVVLLSTSVLFWARRELFVNGLRKLIAYKR